MYRYLVSWYYTWYKRILFLRTNVRVGAFCRASDGLGTILPIIGRPSTKDCIEILLNRS